MAHSISYNRAKSTAVNSTPLVHSYKAAETGGTVAAVVAGTGAGVNLHVEVDADESAGTSVQKVWRLEIVPKINAAGVMELVTKVIPVLGTGSDHPASRHETLTVQHPDNADTWQTAAGRAKQA